ncbi:hypothetical protein BDF14DRAFT_1864423 [Spinellus fusiger]|nr:hypothetical protein BDF14DRAFT_1864423 [Spinellus fusiger]
MQTLSYSPLTSRCCGCIDSRLGSIIVCFLWAGFSFYLAVLAFMGMSPFFSHLDTTPLIVFGVINLVFGLVSLVSFIVLIIRSPYFAPKKSLAYAVTLSASAVLIDLLVNFVLFCVNQATFQTWCIQDSYQRFQADFKLTTHQEMADYSTVDIYNCSRLYQDEMKWSLLAVVCLYVIYIYWIVVIVSYVYRYQALNAMTYTDTTLPVTSLESNGIPPMTETMMNIPPSKSNVSHHQHPNTHSLQKILGRFRHQTSPVDHPRWNKLDQSQTKRDTSETHKLSDSNAQENIYEHLNNETSDEGDLSITPTASRTIVFY